MEMERLASTNRELTRENSKLSSRLKVVSASNVEKLLRVNEKLREELEKIELSVSLANTARISSKSFTFRDGLSEQFNQTTGLLSPYFADMTTRFDTETQKADKELIVELKQQIHDLKLEKEELVKQRGLTDSSRKEKELEERIKSLESEKIQLGKDIGLKQETEQRLKKELEASRAGFERDVKKLTETIEKQQKEIDFYRERLNELQPYVVLANSFQRERELLGKTIEEKYKEIADLKTRVEALEPLQKENKLLKQKYFIIRTAGELLKQRNEEQIKRMDQMQQLVDTEELLDTEINIRQLMEERDLLAAQNERMTKALKDKILQLDILQFKVSSELEEFQNLKKSLLALDESQLLTSSRIFRNDLTPESGRFRDETVKALGQRAGVMKGFQAALKDVEVVKDFMESMNRELRELHERNDSTPSDFGGLSKRGVAISYTNF